MRKTILAALFGVASLACAGEASATTMVGQARGYIETYAITDYGYPPPFASPGDPIMIEFTYDTERCTFVTVGLGGCEGGNAFGTPPVINVTFDIDGFTGNFGSEFDVLYPGSYRAENPSQVMTFGFNLALADLTTPFWGDVTGGGQISSGCCGAYPFETTFTLDRGYLHALGVPEPTTWATMLVGLFALGTALRSRRGIRAAAARS